MERMTWSEIKQRYPDRWVGLVDVKWKNPANVESAVVKYTDKSASDLLRLQFDGEDLFSIYTTPDNMGQLGFVGCMGVSI